LRPLVDEVHAVNLKTWQESPFSISTLQRVAKVWNDVRDARYDAAVDLQGTMRSGVLARLSGARVVYGAAEPRESPASLWYTRKVVARGRHVVEQNLSIAEALVERGMKPPASDIPCDLPYDPQSEERTEQGLAQHNVRDFAILNPGAGWGAKRWPAERYGRVARALADSGVNAILNYGPGEENLAREAEAASEGAARPMQCSITELIALTRRARLFIGGDTGPLHLAAALQVPVVAIFGPTDPARNGPYRTQCIVLRNPASPTTHARRAEPDLGLLEIGVDSVVDAARLLLAAGKSGGQHPHRTEGVHG
jgi:heptosyltransferase I